MISSTMRDVLIEHAHGRPVRELSPGDFEPFDRPKIGRRLQVVRNLIGRGWLKPDPSRPRHFLITADGREALREALDDWGAAIERCSVAAAG